MSENIDHDAAKLIAKQAIKIYGMAGGHLNVGHLNISLAYLDLHAQLAAERARVEALEAALGEAIEDIQSDWHGDIDRLTAIKEGRDERQD